MAPGDYHLNINLQMCYWASHPLNLFETAAPLGPFLHKLAAAGARTAKEWYGIGTGGGEGGEEGDGGTSFGGAPWVAHG